MISYLLSKFKRNKPLEIVIVSDFEPYSWEAELELKDGVRATRSFSHLPNEKEAHEHIKNTAKLRGHKVISIKKLN